MGSEPWQGQSYMVPHPDHPVVYISWDDAQDLVRRLNEVEGEDVYRMPTEAEWEYACRAGTTTAYSFGNRAGLLGDYAWYQANTWADGEPYAHPVGSLLPNPWGLYDMHGNVWEWVQDWLGGYPAEAQIDPVGPPGGVYRVVRSGIFMAGPMGHRSAFRYGGAQDFPDGGVGVRLVRVKP
jgi:formylglycine-generating enzyme required for sulfatase activity